MGKVSKAIRGVAKQRADTAKMLVKEGITNPVAIAKSITQDIKGNVQFLKDIFQQHPEWYTHYPTSNLVNINLATKQNIPLPNTEFVFDDTATASGQFPVPVVATVALQLVTPAGDLEGWRSGVRLLWQQLRTANSGAINYSPADLERYIQNARVVWAISATLNRLYKTTYTYLSTNASVPYSFITAMGCDPESIISNSANLLMYTQRFEQQIRVNVPITMDYINRTRWLFENVFVEGQSIKAQYYIPIIHKNYSGLDGQLKGGLMYYTTDNGNPIVNIGWSAAVSAGQLEETWDYDTLILRCEEIKNAILNDPLMQYIAGDMIKAFGDRAFQKSTAPQISDTLEPVFDEYILSQFQNAYVTNVTDTTADANQLANLSCHSWYNEVFDSEGWINSSFYVDIQNNTANIALTGRVADIRERSANRQTINYAYEDITPGQVMSITRLCPTNYVYDNSAGQSREYYTTYGTEIVVGVVMLQQAYTTGAQPSITKPYYYTPISGLLLDTVGVSGTYLSAFGWSVFDYAPKFRIGGVDTNNTKVSSISPCLFDFGILADVDANHLQTYFSYGNQSLLYAGSSQNQADTDVYATSSGKAHLVADKAVGIRSSGSYSTKRSSRKGK